MEHVFKQWITDGSGHPFYARKTLSLGQKPVSAKLAVCGLGQFQLSVNGQKVGDRVLDPAWTDYNKLVDYVVFDLTELLAPGANAIGVEVGNGWYKLDTEGGYTFHFPPFMPPNPNPYQPYGESLVLAAHLTLTYADGSAETLDADESWKVALHPVQVSNVYGSEIIDGRKRIPGWCCADFDDSGWENASPVPKDAEPKGTSEEQHIPPVKIIADYEGKFLRVVNQRAVYDFGQNVSGLLECTVKGKAGDVIRIYPAEKLGPDGDVDQMAKNWLLIDACETYTIAEDDVWETFSMTFTYAAGKFAAVEGCAPDAVRELQMHAVSSAGEAAGSFACDDPRYLQIYSIIEKAVEANMLGVHTDCPTIERFAWQEENHLMAPAIMYMKQVKPHWEKFLKDTRTAQHKAGDCFKDMQGGTYYVGDGLVPSQAPCYIPNVLPVPGMGSFYDIIGWGSSIIIGTNWHYLFYGDKQILRDNYDAGKRYLAYLRTMLDGDGFISHGLGDWGNPDGKFARANVETAFLYGDASILAKFAAVLAEDQPENSAAYRADEQAFLAFAEEVKANYNAKLLVYDEAKGHYCYRLWDDKDGISTTQAAEAMPLFWGLVPEAQKGDIAAALREATESAGGFRAGEVGLPYIIQSLCKYGMNDLIASYLLKETHPSYYAFVLAGETTLGEYWEENPRSHCHDMMGHIAQWYYDGIAGIRPLAPGFRKVLIRPYLPPTMNEMTCTYRSASGPITVALKRGGEGVSLDVQAAPGIDVVIDKANL